MEGPLGTYNWHDLAKDKQLAKFYFLGPDLPTVVVPKKKKNTNIAMQGSWT